MIIFVTCTCTCYGDNFTSSDCIKATKTGKGLRLAWVPSTSTQGMRPGRWCVHRRVMVRWFSGRPRRRPRAFDASIPIRRPWAWGALPP